MQSNTYQLRPFAITLAHTSSRLDESRQIGRGVMRRDPMGAVTQEVLPILEAHAGRPQTTTEGVLEVVHPNLRQVRPGACLAPRPGQHVLQGFTLVGEHVACMLPSLPIEHLPGHPIENDGDLARS